MPRRYLLSHPTVGAIHESPAGNAYGDAPPVPEKQGAQGFLPGVAMSSSHPDTRAMNICPPPPCYPQPPFPAKTAFPPVFAGFLPHCENVFSNPKTNLVEFGRKRRKIHRESTHIFPFKFVSPSFSLFYRCENVFSLSAFTAPLQKPRRPFSKSEGARGLLRGKATVIPCNCTRHSSLNRRRGYSHPPRSRLAAARLPPLRQPFGSSPPPARSFTACGRKSPPFPLAASIATL